MYKLNTENRSVYSRTAEDAGQSLLAEAPGIVAQKEKKS
jgi:hypothetical protein